MNKLFNLIDFETNERGEKKEKSEEKPPVEHILDSSIRKPEFYQICEQQNCVGLSFY